MSEWFYLSLGFALLFFLQRGKRQKRPRQIWKFSLELSGVLILLLTVDTLFSRFLWSPLGRGDLRLLSLFLWALLIDRGRGGPFFWALLAFSLWTLGEEGILPLRERFVGGLGLVWGAKIFETLLEGLRERLKLSNLPPALEGTPILFWLAGILSLAFWGFHGLAGVFVN